MTEARVALLLGSLRFGGAERGFVNLARALDARGVKVDFCLGETQGAFAEELPTSVSMIKIDTHPYRRTALHLALRIPGLVRTLPKLLLKKPRYLPTEVRMVPSIAAYLREKRPDALLTTMPRNNLCALWAKHLAGVPTRVVIREASTFSIEAQQVDGQFDRNWMTLAREWYPRAASIISVCDGVADDLSLTLGIPRARIATVYNPIDLDRIKQLAKAPSPHAWLDDPSTPVIVTVGRLQPQKDHETLLRALAKLDRKRGLRLIVLGEGERRDALETTCGELGISDRVCLAGNQPNPYAYMARASLFVLSSAWEGFPNVLLEALACKIPVVSTDCPSGGPRELLCDGALGTLVPPADPEALAEAISAVLDQPRQDAAKGFAYVSGFTLERSAASYMAQLLGRNAEDQLDCAEA